MIELNELVLGKLTVKYSLVGIVSAGAEDCSKDQLSTIFTDVRGYSDWIANKIDETEYSNSGRYCTVDNDQQSDPNFSIEPVCLTSVSFEKYDSILFIQLRHL